MKILNLYAGIGGNRKLWTPNGDEHDITAVNIGGIWNIKNLLLRKKPMNGLKKTGIQ